MEIPKSIGGILHCVAMLFLLPPHAHCQTTAESMQQSSGIGAKPQAVVPAPSRAAVITFRPAGVKADGLYYGQHVGFDSYRASDGGKVMVIYTDFKDSAVADTFLQVVVGHSCRVISKSERLAKNGKAAGERYEVLIEGKENDCDKEFFAVVWTDGVKFHEMISASKEDALALEKVYRY